MSAAVLGVEAAIRMYAGDGACAAELLCDGHEPDAIAFTLIESDLSHEDITYGQLRERSERGAAALAGLGVGPGEAVATLMGKSADLVVMLLAIWRRGAVHVPLFTAFAWPAIELRLNASGAKVVISDEDQRGKIHDTAAAVVVAGDRPAGSDLSLRQLLASHEPGIPAEAVGGGGALVLIFTSGTTGAPKGVPVPLRALAASASTSNTAWMSASTMFSGTPQTLAGPTACITEFWARWLLAAAACCCTQGSPRD